MRSAPLAGLALAVVAAAQPALLRDVNRQAPLMPLGSDPFDWMVAGPTLFFVATDPLLGRELHATDGTIAGTGPIADVTPGYAAGTFGVVAYGNGVAFVVGDGLRSGLWTSDGTVQGTRRILALGDGPGESQPSGLTPAGGVLWFAAGDAAAGTELWTSDGTASGTRRSVDLEPGPRGSDPRDLRPLGGRLFFTAETRSHGREPWIAGGMPATVQLLADTVPGHLNSALLEVLDAPVQGRLLFESNGDLWVTSGTPSATAILVRGLDLHGTRTAALGNAVYFATEAPDALWRSDGTPSGTVRVQTFPGEITVLDAVQGRVVFAVRGSGLWATQGTAASTLWLAPVQGFSATRLGNDLLVATGLGLWRTDGTPVGTTAVASGYRAMGSLGPEFGGRVWFLADEGQGAEPFVSDGTAAGTGQFADLAQHPPGATAGSEPRECVAWNGRAAWLADDGIRLAAWTSDGTPAGTVPVAWQATFSGQRDTPRLCFAAGHLFGLGDAAMSGMGTLFAHDGVTAQRLATIPGAGPFTEWTTWQGGVAIAADLLWVSDGTPSGTQPLTSGLGLPAFPSAPTAVGGTVAFTGFDGTSSALFVTDGATLQRVRASVATGLTAARGHLFFADDDGVHGTEPWISDGTVQGTKLLLDIQPGADGSFPTALAVLRAGVLFAATDPLRGTELWFCGGSTATTFPLPEIVPGQASPLLGEAVATRRGAVLVIGEPNGGREPWVFDSAGLRRITDLHPGAASSNPRHLVRVGDEVWFVADEPEHGLGLWRTDGTAGGTVLVTRLRREPEMLLLASGRMFVDLDDPRVGRELFEFAAGATAEPYGHGCSTSMREPWLESSDPVLGRSLVVEGGGGAPGRPAALVLGRPAAPSFTISGRCRSFVDAASAFVAHVVPDSSAPWTFALPVPNDPALDGLALTAQSWNVAATAGIETSRGVRLTLGTR